jgi:hypothetical protein
VKLPSFQFYPGDWLKDPALRRCNHAEKGVWIDMLCLMWENDESRGVLITGSQPWSLEEVACAVGGNLDSTKGHLSSLLSKGVAKRRADGAIYCARMVRDEEKRRSTAQRVRNHRNACVTHDVTHQPPVTLEVESEREDVHEDSSLEEQCLLVYQEYPRKVGKPAAISEIRKALKKVGFDVLSEATKGFARAVEGKEERYIPHPSTWFHQERYSDDPKTWGGNHRKEINHEQF